VGLKTKTTCLKEGDGLPGIFRIRTSRIKTWRKEHEDGEEKAESYTLNSGSLSEDAGPTNAWGQDATPEGERKLDSTC